MKLQIIEERIDDTHAINHLSVGKILRIKNRSAEPPGGSNNCGIPIAELITLAERAGLLEQSSVGHDTGSRQQEPNDRLDLFA